MAEIASRKATDGEDDVDSGKGSNENRVERIVLSSSELFDPKQEENARRRKMPILPKPMLPSATREAPQGDDWLHEIKYDGYRMLCCVRNGHAKFVSRNGNDWTKKVPHLAGKMSTLPVQEAIFDGEIVAMSRDGTTDFQALQNTIGRGHDSTLRYYLFDLLHLDGYDLTGVGLEQRKTILKTLLASNRTESLQYSEHIRGNGPTVFQHACRLGTEGIVSKRADRKYTSGRTIDWLKTKSLMSAEFVVGGYTESTTSRYGFGSLVLGAYEGEDLIYLGRVGTGFTDLSREFLSASFGECRSDQNPFQNLEAGMIDRRVYWLQPIHVAEVEFGGWTVDTVLRFPSFRGMRPDIEADQVTVLQATSQQPLALQLESTGLLSTTTASERESVTDLAGQSGDDSGPVNTPNSNSPLDLPPSLVGNVERLNLTHPNRVMYPATGVTKLAIAEHYIRVAHLMLPHLVDRPLALVRCPQGIGKHCFFQKNRIEGIPDSVECKTVALNNTHAQDVLYVRDLAGLLALVQFSSLEFHVWGSRIDRPDRPDRFVIDLDPDVEIPFSRVCRAAFEIRDRLAAVGLVSFLKTTGGKGLHVIVPIRRTTEWSDLYEFSVNFCGKLAATSPSRYTTKSAKRDRVGKIYLDYQRNAFGATTIAAYSTRTRPGACISTPLDWSELETLRSADCYSVANIQRRVANQASDPWQGINGIRQTITKSAMKSFSH